jgi:hypothetical protein
MLQSLSWRYFPVLVVALIAACTSQPVARTTVDRVLKAPSVPNAPYASIVLVGVAPTRDVARQLEQGVVRKGKQRHRSQRAGGR